MYDKIRTNRKDRLDRVNISHAPNAGRIKLQLGATASAPKHKKIARTLTIDKYENRYVRKSRLVRSMYIHSPERNTRTFGAGLGIVSSISGRLKVATAASAVMKNPGSRPST
jgi:hypothetical protein